MQASDPGDAIGDLNGLSFASSSTYTIIEEIGRGGHGIVFLAEKDTEGVVDEVVLKTLRELGPDQAEKLQREANIATRLRHENIVKTYGLESIPLGGVSAAFQKEMTELSGATARRSGAAPLSLAARKRLRRRRVERARGERPADAGPQLKMYMLVMDYVAGTDLRTLHRDHLRKRRLIPPLLGAFVVSRVCRALAYAHGSIIHRDISPENVLIDHQGVCKLSDFGIAVPAEGPDPACAGKLGYMAPEHLRGDPIDARSDIYSLGIVLYQVLTGIPIMQPPPSLPFEEQRYEALRLIEGELPAPHEVRFDIPEVLGKICMRMIEPDPEHRAPRAEDVGSALEQKYLYAEGFGPTNNSLAAYVQLFERDFADPTQDELRQLKFLQALDGKIRLTRSAAPEEYTEVGQRLRDAYRDYRKAT